jgi:hypothetical protein
MQFLKNISFLICPCNILMLMVLFLLSCNNPDYHAGNTTAEARQAFTRNWQDKMQLWQQVTKILSQKEIDEFCWYSMAFKQTDEEIKVIFKKIFDYYEVVPENTRYNMLLARWSLFNDLDTTQLVDLLANAENPKINALLISWISQKDSVDFLQYVLRDSPYKTVIAGKNDYLLPDRVDWKEVFKHSALAEKKNIWVFLPRDRTIPGRAFIQQGDGTLLTGKNNELLKYGYLGLSASNAPYYLTNGNTPCGIYSIQELQKSSNAFIGPVEMVVTAMPFEISAGRFFKSNRVDSAWSMETYQGLVPPALQKYSFMYQSYEAGKLGRSEIVMHGTTIDPEFFKNTSYYPYTPSLGCLCGKELWDPKNGHLLESEHAALIKAYKKLKAPDGYLIVIQLNTGSEEELIEQLKHIQLNGKAV